MPLEPVESRGARVERLFHEALEMDDDSRDAFLAAACQGDEPMRLAIVKLIGAHERVGRNPSWNEPAIQNEARQGGVAPEDTALERYRLLEQIGAGGMGVVYKAVRADDEFSKLVAIKIVQAGGGGQEAVVRRFRQERQILAALDHPNIARLLDGGTTPDGLPFLVMDYVVGVNIDVYVAQRKPAQPEILELFRTVCSAVSYAHQNLVVHRDLKPSNVLVTPAGTPKLIDFGVAKLLDGSGERTLTGAAGMTPEYASPEQLRGRPINTATDVYSLGVLLYEMLAGVRPYRNTGNAMDLAQAICTETPEPMSARGRQRFDSDLENIVQMALRKEPERRYASVEQFSEDLRRYLENYPVAARSATRGYRARKFAGRNRAPIAAASLVLLTLIGGIAATMWEAHVANRRFNDVRELANSYLFEFHDAIKDLPGSTPARQLVVKRGIVYLDKLAREHGNDASLQRELANAYDKVGQVQGAPGYPNLGDRAGALESYRKALALREPLAAANPRDQDTVVELNRSYQRIGELLQAKGDLKAAAEIERKGVQSLEKLAAAHAPSVPVLVAMADGYAVLADVTGNNEQSNLGDTSGAIGLYRKAQAIREKLVAEYPGNREYRVFLAISDVFIGQLEQALDKKEESAAAFRLAIALEEQLIREDPFNVVYKRNAAVAYRSLALLLIRMKHLPEAQADGNRSGQLFEQLTKADPANLQALEEFADSCWSQGYLREKAKDLAGARPYYEAAIQHYDEVTARRGGAIPGGLRTAYQLLADLGTESGDASLALRCARKELDIDGQLLTASPVNVSAQRNRGVAFTQIGQAHESLARRKTLAAARRTEEWGEARAWYQRGLDVWMDLRRRGLLIPMYAPKVDEATRNISRCDQALGSDGHRP
jgi:tetratricopeptide (TPR) repeat protein